MKILGISAYYHDSSAALINDGKIIFATEEERFSRKKHDNNFPKSAIENCLKFCDTNSESINYVAYYEKPLLKFERILDNLVLTFPRSPRIFIKAISEWLSQKINVASRIKKAGFKKNILYIPHHTSHASAAFYPSSFNEAAILTIDGIGEYQTTGLWIGKENKIEALADINFPNSIGLMYSTFTAFLGFDINNDEYKVMGLAAYGKPIYEKYIDKIIDIKNDGSFKLNMKFFSFTYKEKMWSKEFENIFGKPRKKTDPLTQRHKDLAASIQKATENLYFKILNHLNKITGLENLCIGGGVALNSLANGKILEHTSFKNIYIFGPSGDNGAAIGAALYTYHHILGNKRNSTNVSNLQFGKEYSDIEIEIQLKKYNLKFEYYIDEEKFINEVANYLSKNKIIGWFQGRSEFGPRALGGRSIIANPIEKSMKEYVNKIKRREQFRPFAGSIMKEYLRDWFEIPTNINAFPFMNFCFKAKKIKKDKLAAIVHEDGTTRVQTVDDKNTIYYKLIKKFYEKTGVPCILNTSFNLKGEPIVETPEEAIQDFLKTEMDLLAIGKFIINKNL